MKLQSYTAFAISPDIVAFFALTIIALALIGVVVRIVFPGSATHKRVGSKFIKV